MVLFPNGFVILFSQGFAWAAFVPAVREVIHRYLNRPWNRPNATLPIAYRLVAGLAHAQGSGQRVLRMAHALTHGYEVCGVHA